MKMNLGQSPQARAKALQELRDKATKSDALALNQKLPAPAEASERLRIIADDSGSMTRHEADVREGIIEFFRNCIPGTTAAAVHMLCTPDDKNNLSLLNSNLIELASWMKLVHFGFGGTPLFGALKRALEAKPQATRLIAFTDGSPTDHLATYLSYDAPERKLLLFPTQRDADIIIELAGFSPSNEGPDAPYKLKVPIDTVFFGSAERVRDWNWVEGMPESEREKERDEVLLLKYLAEKTGGFFLHFDPAKMDFRKGLKYLAPSLRLMLASESVRKEVESGTRS